MTLIMEIKIKVVIIGIGSIGDGKGREMKLCVIMVIVIKKRRQRGSKGAKIKPIEEGKKARMITMSAKNADDVRGPNDK